MLRHTQIIFFIAADVLGRPKRRETRWRSRDGGKTALTVRADPAHLQITGVLSSAGCAAACIGVSIVWPEDPLHLLDLVATDGARACPPFKLRRAILAPSRGQTDRGSSAAKPPGYGSAQRRRV